MSTTKNPWGVVYALNQQTRSLIASVKRVGELENDIYKLTGYDLDGLKKMLAMGYTINPPLNSRHLSEDKTYKERYERFLNSTGIDKQRISDYRPATPPYSDLDMPNRIIVWFKDGSSVIY